MENFVARIIRWWCVRRLWNRGWGKDMFPNIHAYRDSISIPMVSIPLLMQYHFALVDMRVRSECALELYGVTAADCQLLFRYESTDETYWMRIPRSMRFFGAHAHRRCAFMTVWEAVCMHVQHPWYFSAVTLLTGSALRSCADYVGCVIRVRGGITLGIMSLSGRE